MESSLYRLLCKDNAEFVDANDLWDVLQLNDFRVDVCYHCWGAKKYKSIPGGPDRYTVPVNRIVKLAEDLELADAVQTSIAAAMARFATFREHLSTGNYKALYFLEKHACEQLGDELEDVKNQLVDKKRKREEETIVIQ